MPLNRILVFLTITVVGCAADLLTKYAIFRKYFDPYERPQQYWWIDGVFGIECTTNPGALFGIGQGYSFWFAILSIVALIGVVTWLFVFRGARDLWLTVCMSMISGGILGNLYDRLGFGYIADSYPAAIRDNVRDWIHFRWQGISFLDPWPNFNIADSLLVCGAAMLMVHALFAKPNSEETGE